MTIDGSYQKGQNVLNVVFAGRAAIRIRIEARALSHIGLTPSLRGGA